jgi:hypothetical protein
MHVCLCMLKAAIATILLGTSTMAAADTPYPGPYQGDYPGDRFDDRRNDYDRTRDQGLYNDTRDWRRNRVILADNVTLGGRNQQAVWVPIDARHGIDRVRIKLQAGRAFIDNVTIVYADGTRESMQLRRVLTVRDPSITVDLRRGGVRGIMIDSTQRGYARGGGWRRFSSASVDVIGIRR